MIGPGPTGKVGPPGKMIGPGPTGAAGPTTIGPGPINGGKSMNIGNGGAAAMLSAATGGCVTPGNPSMSLIISVRWPQAGLA